MVPFRDVSIRQKLIFIIMVICMGTLLLSFCGFLAYNLIQVRHATIRETCTIAEIVAHNCTASLIFSDPNDARKVLSSLRSHPPIVSAWIFSKNSRPFAGYTRDSSAGASTPAQLREPGHYFEGGTFICCKPIWLEDVAIGTISIESDLNIMYAAIKNQAIMMVQILIFAAVCAFLISSKLQRLITGPIIALAELTQSVSRNKDFSIRGTRIGRDEIGGLVENFNHMLAEIEKQNAEIVGARKGAEVSEQKALTLASEMKSINLKLEKEIKARKAAQKALEKHRLNLEKLVVQRTRKLIEINARLSLEIDDRKAAEQRIKESLEEKKSLLGEIHHRVKNNLQAISNLLDMTRRRALNEEARTVLSEARSRIHTMAMIHSQLYESDNFSRIDMKKHINTLLEFISQMYLEQRRRIIPVIDGEGVHLSVTQAVPCALVLTELISNVFKHAYDKDQDGQLLISITQSEDAWVNIRIKDHGKGLPEEVDMEHTETLGLKLVRNLILKQLKGEFELVQQEGTEINLSFPIDHDDLIFR